MSLVLLAMPESRGGAQRMMGRRVSVSIDIILKRPSLATPGTAGYRNNGLTHHNPQSTVLICESA